MVAQTFKTKLVAGESKNVTGIVVPDKVIAALGGGLRPRLQIEVNGYAFTATPGRMAGKTMISFSGAHRVASGLSGGEEVTVWLELATAPEAIEPPEDLKAAIAEAGIDDAFAEAAPSKRREWVRQVMEAKGDDTRRRRIQKVVEAVRA
jgi:Bacteriocin-protection, YdeI or OmpD-Associated/Domain of unknown function (DUF1905)